MKPASVFSAASTAVLAFALVAGGPATIPAAATGAKPSIATLPKVTAAAWLVADLDTGQIVAARAPHRRLAPASTLKALTLLSLAPSIPVDDAKRVYTATDGDASIDGSKVGLVPRSTYRPVDLWHGLMLGSGNDCAHALGEIAGGQAKAVALMRAEALRLGATDTVVKNTSGLDDAGQVSSAFDLALFGRAVLGHRDLAGLVQTTSYTFPAAGKTFSGKRTKFQIQNHNRLLRNYDGALGVKNGYTVAAGGSFIGAARRGKHAYLVTVIKAKGSTWHMTRDLLDWAFANGSAVSGGARAKSLGTLVDAADVDPATGRPISDSAAGADAGGTNRDPGATPAAHPGTGKQAAARALPAVTSTASSGSGLLSSNPWIRALTLILLTGAGAIGLLAFGRRRSAHLAARSPRHSSS